MRRTPRRVSPRIRALSESAPSGDRALLSPIIYRLLFDIRVILYALSGAMARCRSRLALILRLVGHRPLHPRWDLRRLESITRLIYHNPTGAMKRTALVAPELGLGLRSVLRPHRPSTIGTPIIYTNYMQYVAMHSARKYRS